MSRANVRTTRKFTPHMTNMVRIGVSCKYCESPIPPGRKTFCQDACSAAYMLVHSPSYARTVVFARDKGVCQSCGLDTTRLERSRRSAQRQSKLVKGWGESPYMMATECVGDELEAEGIPRRWATKTLPLWQVDHIIPMNEGGATLGLSNMRTLCVGCHAKVTAAYQRRRGRTDE